jgi:hypothetical protein
MKRSGLEKRGPGMIPALAKKLQRWSGVSQATIDQSTIRIRKDDKRNNLSTRISTVHYITLTTYGRIVIVIESL